MKKLLCIAVSLVFVLLVLLSGCQIMGPQATPEPTQGGGFMSRVEGSTFFSLESMTEAIQKAKQFPEETTEGNLEDVEYYYVPANLPEGYNLYEVNVNNLNFRFTYIKAENPQDIGEEGLQVIWAKQEAITFWFRRGIYENQMELEIKLNRKTKEDLIDGKYLYSDDPQELLWEEGGHIQKLYLQSSSLQGNYTQEEVLSFGHAKRVDIPKE